MNAAFSPLKFQIELVGANTLKFRVETEEAYEKTLTSLLGPESHIAFLEEDGTGEIFYKNNVKGIYIMKVT